jgi:hypothetical protein
VGYIKEEVKMISRFQVWLPQRCHNRKCRILEKSRFVLIGKENDRVMVGRVRHEALAVLSDGEVQQATGR